MVSEPVYWKSFFVWSASTTGPKSSGPVFVTVPGSWMSLMFLMTFVRSSVVEPSSVSWKGIARTAMEPS